MKVKRVVIKVTLEEGIKLDKVIYPDKDLVTLEDLQNLLDDIAVQFKEATISDFFKK